MGKIKVGDLVEILEDGAMIRKGDLWIVLEVSANGKFFYYCGGLALSVNSGKYKIVNTVQDSLPVATHYGVPLGCEIQWEDKT